MEETYKEIYRDLLRYKFRIKSDGLYDSTEHGGERIYMYSELGKVEPMEYEDFFYIKYGIK